MFTFNCSTSTSKKIIEVHKLKLDTVDSDNGFGLQHEFEWWNKERIKKLPKYSWKYNDQYFKYYWYDAEKGKAYFFEFNI